MEHFTEPNYCQVKVDLLELRGEIMEIRGEISAELAKGEQIMRSLKASIDASTNRFEKLLEKYEVILDAQESRIAGLEKKVWYASGATGVVMFLLGIFWKYLPFLKS